MARVVKPLTHTEVKNAQAVGKDLKLYDGGGLQLRVRVSGTKSWVFDYFTPLTNKRTRITFGKYPAISLQEARRLRDEAKALLAKGIDPKEAKNEKVKEQKLTESNTLYSVAKSWLEVKKSKVTADYALDIWRSLELHILPILGARPISSIRAPETIDVIKAIAARGNFETVRRVIQRLNEIMTYAVNTGVIESNRLTGIKAAFETPSKKHMPSIRPEELPELMLELSRAQISFITRCVIEWQLHTMTRPSESTGAMWSEIDFVNSLWVIPKERMKNRKEHTIPLSTQTLGLLEMMKPISSQSKFIFPSAKSLEKHIHPYSPNMALKRMGFKSRLVAHGLRALASTTLNEQGFDKDVIEAALSHSDKNQIRSAYNRSTYLDARKKMMQWWSSHIEDAARGAINLSSHTKLRSVV
ncbi:integrase domain-containing protein [Agarivorans litoreus]|uniref:integrase domain-containing protein n=1 Tax=Agarivorans litoreus TaxID=1510455 RepID=UPI001C7E09D9|nr:integrase domain-containing protein [Agarivorans litoreus]